MLINLFQFMIDKIILNTTFIIWI